MSGSIGLFQQRSSSWKKYTDDMMRECAKLPQAYRYEVIYYDEHILVRRTVHKPEQFDAYTRKYKPVDGRGHPMFGHAADVISDIMYDPDSPGLTGVWLVDKPEAQHKPEPERPKRMNKIKRPRPRPKPTPEGERKPRSTRKLNATRGAMGKPVVEMECPFHKTLLQYSAELDSWTCIDDECNTRMVLDARSFPVGQDEQPTMLRGNPILIMREDEDRDVTYYLFYEDANYMVAIPFDEANSHTTHNNGVVNVELTFDDAKGFDNNDKPLRLSDVGDKDRLL
jgi:hypothetical protein